jgi:hypothetical protein
MKVNLAAQTISASVADAIEFCDLVLRDSCLSWFCTNCQVYQNIWPSVWHF